jgi:hypothetical protein
VSIEKVRIESQEELEQMISKEIGQVEKNLNLICSDVPVNDKTNIDILCHDENGQLVIVQMNVNEDDIMLLHGIQSLDYVDKFKTFLKATYGKNKIDEKQKPRLILIAPSFSDAVRKAVESMQGIRVDLYEWEYLKLGDHKGLRLQPIFAVSHPEKPVEEKSPEKKRDKSSKKKEYEPEPEPQPAEEVAPEPETQDSAPPPEEPQENATTYEPEEKEEPRKKRGFF